MFPKWNVVRGVDSMDKLSGTVLPVSIGKAIKSIKVQVTINSSSAFKVSDIQIQEGGQISQYNPFPFDAVTDEKEEVHYNFLARGKTTVIVPYMSEAPYEDEGVTLPVETGYITTPVKADFLIHKAFSKTSEELSLGPGLSGESKRFRLNEDIDSYTHCVYDGYTSRQYVDSEERNIFVGRELFTLKQNEGRKTTGILYANKTRREV